MDYREEADIIVSPVVADILYDWVSNIMPIEERHAIEIRARTYFDCLQDVFNPPEWGELSVFYQDYYRMVIIAIRYNQEIPQLNVKTVD